MGEAQYLSTYSKLSSDKESVLREDFDICSKFELIFLDDTFLVFEAPSGCLSVYLAQFGVGLRFPLHSLSVHVLKF